MKTLKSFLKKLKAFDLVVVVFYLFLITVNIIFHSRVELWPYFIALNLFIILFAFGISYLEDKFKPKIWEIIHYWYIAPLVLITFKELYFLIKPIRVYDYDWLFIRIDRWIFGTNPTHFLYKISNPVLTEILQIVYGMFYLLPIILGLALYAKKTICCNGLCSFYDYLRILSFLPWLFRFTGNWAKVYTT